MGREIFSRRTVFGIERLALALDLGSSHVAVAKGETVPLFREPSRVAFSFRTPQQGRAPSPFSEGRMAGAGVLGKEELLRRPQTTRLAAPVSEGRLREFHAASQLLAALFQSHRLTTLRTRFLGGTLMVLVPPDASAAETQTWVQLGEALNCGRVRTVDSMNAAVQGLGLDIQEPRGQMVVDIGGGATRVAIYSLGEKAGLTCVPVGGEHLDLAVQAYIHQRYRLNLEHEPAENIRMSIGSVFPKARPEFMEISARDFSTGIVKKVTLDDNEIRDVLLNACEPIVAAITQTFEQVPPELAADVAQGGVTLIGGGALLSGLTSFLAERTGVMFRLAEDPMNTALRGAVLMLNHSQHRR